MMNADEEEETEEQKQENEKLLRLMTGYGQHASPKTMLFSEYHNAQTRKS
jgi:hypothetical protein